MPPANNSFLEQIIKVIERHLSDEKFGVSELAKEMGMSREVLYRKIKAATRQSASRFITEVRLKKALELLEQNAGNVSEIAYQVGFGSPSYFIKCFREKYGFSPGEVQNGNHSYKEPEAKANPENKKIRFVWAAAVVVLLLVSSVALYFLTFNKKDNEIKSIAVLPPMDYNPEGSKCLILEGFREDLLNNLYKIHELQVASRTSTDTYRNSEKTGQQIARELNVDYFIEISGQYVDSVNTIWVQLIDAKTDKHLWGDSYNRGLEDERVHEIQQEIALTVADSLKITLSQEELKAIEKLPTLNPVAYSYYRLGLNNLENNRITIIGYLTEAKYLFEKAIQEDSTFGDAYCQLAEIYIVKLPGERDTRTYNAFLDSGMFMLNKALEYQTNLQHKALLLKTYYYSRKGEHEKAIDQFEKLWGKRKKDYTYYFEKTSFYVASYDYYNRIKNVILYLKLKPKSLAPDVSRLEMFRFTLRANGFPKLFDDYSRKLLQGDATLRNIKDSTGYLSRKAWMHIYSGEYNQASEIFSKLYSEHPQAVFFAYSLWYAHYFNRDFENAFIYAQEYEKLYQTANNSDPRSALIASLYRYFGDEEKAQWHIDGHFEECQKMIEENVTYAQHKWVYGDLAGIYSLRGDKKKALENLRIMASRKTISKQMINMVESMLMFDNIRNEPEFKAIVKEMKKKYHTERERIKKLMIQEGYKAE